MPSPFAHLLTPTLLQSLADDRSYQRGDAYFRQGCVRSLVEQGEVIAAKVQGTDVYDVERWLEANQLQYQCDCPVGLEGWFCKHCVAVGLAWLANPPTGADSHPRSRSSVTTMQAVQQYLEQQDHASLVKLIVDRTLKDADWREQLLLKVAAVQPQGVDRKTFQRALKSAITIRGYVEYHEVKGYARSVEKVLDAIAHLLDDGHAEAVIELCEYAIPLLEAAMQSIDDSNGYVGALLAQVQTLHHRACEQAKPDPIALAQRLLEFELTSSFEVFYGAVDTYAAILGESGLHCYRKLAEADWAALPPLSPGQRTSFDSKRWRLSQIMETLARQRGDVDAIVAIKQHDLSNSRTYLQIAALYQEAGQARRALEWAEAGLKAFPDRPDSQLRAFVVAAYHQQGRFEDVLAIVWSEFTELPSLSTFQKLKAEAERSQQWATWRDRAIAHIRQQIKHTKQQKQGMLAFTYRDHSLLVELLLWEGNTEAAWQEAKTGGCSKQLWLQLADQRQHDHPEDSLSLYMNEIEPLIQQTDNKAYAKAVDFLTKARSLMLRLELRSQFEQYREYLRSTYKAKRNFIKLLNEAAL